MATDYQLLVGFTAEQREHLDRVRAQGTPAAVYLRGLVQAELSKGVGGTTDASPAHVSEAPLPTTFNDTVPSETRG